MANGTDRQQQQQTIEFEQDDPEHPRNWTLKSKYLQVLQIWVIAFLLPMASSIATPAANEMSADFDTSKQAILGGQAGFVCMLGIGPLFLAPMSETFGRRKVFLINVAVFTVVQIPTALAPNIGSFIFLRIISGFCGSVGVGNGGGSISDMFGKHERAKVLGFYFIAPLLAPAIGPIVGSVVVAKSVWRNMFWLLAAAALVVTLCCYFFLSETEEKAILANRKQRLQRQRPKVKFIIDGQSDESVFTKILRNSTKAVTILTMQPIVLAMSTYQALVFTSMYTLYAQYPSIWSSHPYNFTKIEVGLAYLGPASGFIAMSILVVLSVDRVQSYLSKDKDHDEPEQRLPLANLGAVFLPVSLFWFGIAIEKDAHWSVPLVATMFFGASQIGIFNPIQT